MLKNIAKKMYEELKDKVKIEYDLNDFTLSSEPFDAHTFYLKGHNYSEEEALKMVEGFCKNLLKENPAAKEITCYASQLQAPYETTIIFYENIILREYKHTIRTLSLPARSMTNIDFIFKLEN